jgi:hypothetical protein
VSRPFADEFRSLTDNQPLAQQIAKMTGGQVLTGNPTRDDLWRREGVTMPVATTPIWLAFALSGIGVFLVDVAVRRVRIDLVGMAKMAAGGFRASKAKAGQQMDALRQAREAAKAAMARRADRPTVGGADADVPVAPAPGVAKTKFEATPQQVRKKDVGPIAVSDAPAKPSGVPGAKKTEVSKDEGMSRLMKAKKRAQDEMTDE